MLRRQPQQWLSSLGPLWSHWRQAGAMSPDPPAPLQAFSSGSVAPRTVKTFLSCAQYYSSEADQGVNSASVALLPPCV
jgi:hypothetical protein